MNPWLFSLLVLSLASVGLAHGDHDNPNKANAKNIDSAKNNNQNNGGDNNNNNRNNGGDSRNNGGNNNDKNNRNKDKKVKKEPKAAPEESSKLPFGVREFKPQRPDPFCAQFRDIPASDGTQRKEGGRACSSTQIGLTPSASSMTSTIIVSPKPGDTIDASVNNTVFLDISNLVSGFFNLANEEYYLAPQTLDPGRAVVQGHQHIVVQKLSSRDRRGNPDAPDPKKFAFFKGVNDEASDREGRSLSATIPLGSLTEDGLYRICTMTGADAHQPHVQGVFQRGPQDDCIRVKVVNTNNRNSKNLDSSEKDKSKDCSGKK